MESTVTGLDRNRYSHRRDIVNFCTTPNDITWLLWLMIANNVSTRKHSQKKNIYINRRKSTLLFMDGTLEKGYLETSVICYLNMCSSSRKFMKERERERVVVSERKTLYGVTSNPHDLSFPPLSREFYFTLCHLFFL